jgi:hypothetical protein
LNTTPNYLDGAVFEIAQQSGQALFHAFTTVVPVLVPILAGLWAVRYVLGKLGF